MDGEGIARSIVRVPLSGVEVVADGLSFPEGPVAMWDGSVIVAEVARGTVSRVRPSGRVEVIVHCGGGPNGAAIGPDGALYVVNNGGRSPALWQGGWVERVDLERKTVEVLYRECEGRRLSAPNDLVFDDAGNFYFTDTGKERAWERRVDMGSLCYASIDGSSIAEVVHPAFRPNGVGLSPDQGTLYFAETETARLRRLRISAPGQVAGTSMEDLSTLVVGLPGYQPLDSLAVDSKGSICVGTLLTGCVTVVEPDGGQVTQYMLPDGLRDPMLTNLCFGGPDLRTAYITLSRSGLLVRCRWPVPGLPLAFAA
jgi:gluconolactonase